jgi:hypothetical protein
MNHTNFRDLAVLLRKRGPCASGGSAAPRNPVAESDRDKPGVILHHDAGAITPAGEAAS